MPRILFALMLVLPTVAHAKGPDLIDDRLRKLPVDLPLDGVDTHGRTRFHLTTRFTPATGALVWTFDARAAFQIFPGLGITFGVPVALVAPELMGSSTRVAMGNAHFGLAGGFGIPLTKGTSEVRGLDLRIGGAVDLYAPSSPLPDEDRAVALAAQHTRVLEPGVWAPRGAGARLRLGIGIEGELFTVAGDVAITPSFAVDRDSEIASLWITPLLRARVVLFDTIEPFVELGGTINAVQPSIGLPGGPSITLSSTGGFQITPGVRFHVLDMDPAVFVSIQPGNDSGVVTIAIDLAAAIKKSARAKHQPDELDRF